MLKAATHGVFAVAYRSQGPTGFEPVPPELELLLEPELPLDPELLLEPELPLDPELLLEPVLPPDPELLLEPVLPLDPELLLEPVLPPDPELLLEPELPPELPPSWELPLSLLVPHATAATVMAPNTTAGIAG